MYMHNVHIGHLNHEKMLEKIWNMFHISKNEYNYLLKAFLIWARDFWKKRLFLTFLVFLCSKIVFNSILNLVPKLSETCHLAYPNQNFMENVMIYVPLLLWAAVKWLF